MPLWFSRREHATSHKSLSGPLCPNPTKKIPKKRKSRKGCFEPSSRLFRLFGTISRLFLIPLPPAPPTQGGWVSSQERRIQRGQRLCARLDNAPRDLEKKIDGGRLEGKEGRRREGGGEEMRQWEGRGREKYGASGGTRGEKTSKVWATKRCWLKSVMWPCRRRGRGQRNCD